LPRFWAQKSLTQIFLITRKKTSQRAAPSPAPKNPEKSSKARKSLILQDFLRVWACANVCNNVRAVSRGDTPQVCWDPYVLDF